jgi:hypothetical protein
MKFTVENVTETVSVGGVTMTEAPLVGIVMEILGVPPPLPLLLPLLLPVPPPLLLLPHANRELRTAARSPALPTSCFIVASGLFSARNAAPLVSLSRQAAVWGDRRVFRRGKAAPDYCSGRMQCPMVQGIPLQQSEEVVQI